MGSRFEWIRLQEGSRNSRTYLGIFMPGIEAVNAGLVSEAEAFSIITQAALRTGLGRER